MKWLILVTTHVVVAVIGFAIGIYTLPILTAPDAPTEAQVRAVAGGAEFTAEFRRDLEDSDALHWGEGDLFIGEESIALQGRLAPGPDYRLYLSPQFVETEADFEALKSSMVEVGPVRTFENFTVAVPESIDTSQYSAVIVWCESFGEFITAAQYR